MSGEFRGLPPEVVQQEETIEFEGSKNYDWPMEKVMRGLVRHDLHLNQDAVYKTLSAELSEKDIIDKVEDDYTGSAGIEMVERVKSKLGDEYVKLLVEPSLSSRIDEFLAFCEQVMTQGQKPTPAELRELFKKSLGKKTVYRAGAFTEAQLADIQANGFIANYYRTKTKEEILSNKDFYESVEYNLTNLQSRVNVHAGAFAATEDSMLISTSDYPEMAQYAAFVQLKEKWPNMQVAGYKFVTIPIEVNEFDNIRYGKYVTHDIHNDATGAWSSPQKKISYRDPGVESFVEFQIPPKNIQFDKLQENDVTKIPEFTYIPDK